MAGQQLKVRARVGLPEIINHLEHLVKALKEGHLHIRKNGETITLRPQNPVILELVAEARLEKDSLREKLLIELRWKGEPEPPEGGAFTISSVDPSLAP